MSSTDKDLEILKTKAKIALDTLEAEAPAKEVASKYIGKSAVPWIVLLVVIGVAASLFLPKDSLPAVIGLIATASMALIQMLGGITGTAAKEEKPEFKVIQNLIERLDREKPQPEFVVMQDLIARLDKTEQPMTVTVDGNKVTVTKGADSVTAMKE